MGLLVAQPRGSVTLRKLAIIEPHRDIDMEPSIKAHDPPARPPKQGFVVVKVKGWPGGGRRSWSPTAAPEASKRRDTPLFPGWMDLPGARSSPAPGAGRPQG
jgi:hypothetical protein